MDCTLTQADLIAYHLAVLPDDARAAVDGHLVACTSCLRAYLALKHHMDAGGRDVATGESDAASPRPSDAARKRLRDAVEAEFTRSPSRAESTASRVRRFFGKPIPLYQGLAVAAATALVMALPTLAAFRASNDAPRSPSAITTTTHGTTDSARPVAESLSIY